MCNTQARCSTRTVHWKLRGPQRQWFDHKPQTASAPRWFLQAGITYLACMSSASWTGRFRQLCSASTCAHFRLRVEPRRPSSCKRAIPLSYRGLERQQRSSSAQTVLPEVLAWYWWPFHQFHGGSTCGRCNNSRFCRFPASNTSALWSCAVQRGIIPSGRINNVRALWHPVDPAI